MKLRTNTLPRDLLLSFALMACLFASSIARGQNTQTPVVYDIVQPPLCINNIGETVRYVDRSTANSAVAAGMAIRDQSGQPIVYRANFAAAPPEFQKFIDRHECAHHQTGDVDRPHPPRNGPDHLMNESISDCVAILRLRDEDGYDRDGFDKVAGALRSEMAKIGFPEISISSRISNIEHCFTQYGPVQDFINGVLSSR